jgi:hypothetical protein
LPSRHGTKILLDEAEHFLSFDIAKDCQNTVLSNDVIVLEVR